MRDKVRYTAWALFVILGGATLYNHLTDKEADNGAACTVIGLLLLFLLELGYAVATRQAKQHGER